MEINFVFQMNSFHRYKREQPLSANAQALWFELFGLFNARRFPDEMAVSTTHLCAILGLSKDTVLRARKELSENHLISVERGGGRAASVVKMVYFQKDCGQVGGETVENAVDNQQADVSEGEHTAFCVANIDASCDAKNDADRTGDFASQESTQAATQEEVCVANIDAKCDTYINQNRGTVNENAYNRPLQLYPSYPSGRGKDGQKGRVVSREAWEKAKRDVQAQLWDALTEASLEADGEDDPICEAAELMTEVYSMQGGTLVIGGVSYAADIVKERLRGLNARRIYDAIDQMKNAAEPIRNIRGYLLSCLFNAASTTNIRAESDYRRYREGR